MIVCEDIIPKLKTAFGKQLMISLEMLGYVSSSPNSQSYPSGLQYLYPNTGNFIALVGNLKAIAAMRSFANSLRRAGAPCEWLPVPLNGIMLPITRRSDHAPFWDYGIPGIMVTDTADLRNPNYHQPSDLLDTLNLSFLGSVAQGLANAIATFSR